MEKVVHLGVMEFREALDFGKRHERIVLSMIQRNYEAYIVDGYCKEYDIFVKELGFGVEVKVDTKSMETGNIVIEVECNGVPSGLTTTKAKYWVIYDGLGYHWFLVKDLRIIVGRSSNLAEFIGNGDSYSKKAYLIKKEELYKHQLNG